MVINQPSYVVRVAHMNLREIFYPWKQLIGQVILDVRKHNPRHKVLTLPVGTHSCVVIEKQEHHKRSQQTQQYRYDLPILQDGSLGWRYEYGGRSGKG
jgi:hypothetical protein